MNIVKFLDNKATVSFSQTRRLIAMRAVKVNGVVCEDSSHNLTAGDVVSIRDQSFKFDGGQTVEGTTNDQASH